MQRNWIGRSEGARVTFPVTGSDARDRGVHHAHRHHLWRDLRPAGAGTSAGGPIRAREPGSAGLPRQGGEVPRPRSRGRRDGAIEKEGFDTGRTAINPFTGKDVPIWIANFVLAEYGTGAIMAVPAHDERDFEFARKYRLPIRIVVRSGETPATADALTTATTNYGTLVDSGAWDGQEAPAVITQMIADAEQRGIGKRRGSVPAEGLGHLPPALLGHADSGDPLRQGRRRAGPVRRSAGRAARR